MHVRVRVVLRYRLEVTVKIVLNVNVIYSVSNSTAEVHTIAFIYAFETDSSLFLCASPDDCVDIVAQKCIAYISLHIFIPFVFHRIPIYTSCSTLFCDIVYLYGFLVNFTEYTVVKRLVHTRRGSLASCYKYNTFHDRRSLERFTVYFVIVILYSSFVNVNSAS